MRQIRLLALFIITFSTVISFSLLKRFISLLLCGLLFFDSSICYDPLGSSHANAAISNSDTLAITLKKENVLKDSLEIAVPPIIREAPLDLQNSLPDDFIVSRQTPYSSGRNEILIVSPSTGTEQRFEINLPGIGSSSFRLYEASFNNVEISSPSRISGDNSSLSDTQIQDKLKSFTISFDDRNLPQYGALADGTEVYFSDNKALIKTSDGQLIETVSLSNLATTTRLSASAKSSPRIIAQIDSGCSSRIRNQIYRSGQSAGNKANILRAANSDEAKMFAWALTFSKRSLEDSLIVGTRNQTLQEVACKPPVQCNQPQTYEGGSEIRTDLFQLPSGIDQAVNLEYEFYEIPDRLELSYEGNIIFSVGPASGRSSSSIGDLPDGAAYVGVKLIGNIDAGTKWWYTISCSSRSEEVAEASSPIICDVFDGIREYRESEGWSLVNAASYITGIVGLNDIAEIGIGLIAGNFTDCQQTSGYAVDDLANIARGATLAVIASVEQASIDAGCRILRDQNLISNRRPQFPRSRKDIISFAAESTAYLACRVDTNQAVDGNGGLDLPNAPDGTPVRLTAFLPNRSQRETLERNGFSQDIESGYWQRQTRRGKTIRAGIDENGRWEVYNVQDSKLVREYAIGLYGSNPSAGADSFIEAHHPIQDAWANEILGSYGYSRSGAITINLQRGFHQSITNQQRSRGRDYTSRTYLQERSFAINELQEAEVPREFIDNLINTNDAYFRNIWEKMPERSRNSIFGDVENRLGWQILQKSIWYKLSRLPQTLLGKEYARQLIKIFAG